MTTGMFKSHSLLFDNKPHPLTLTTYLILREIANFPSNEFCTHNLQRVASNCFLYCIEKYRISLQPVFSCHLMLKEYRISLHSWKKTILNLKICVNESGVTIYNIKTIILKIPDSRNLCEWIRSNYIQYKNYNSKNSWFAQNSQIDS
jgi:hypothetical protein